MAVLERRAPTPFIPVASHPGDSRNFEIYPEQPIHPIPTEAENNPDIQQSMHVDPFHHLFKEF
jgi:hypothetical protein